MMDAFTYMIAFAALVLAYSAGEHSRKTRQMIRRLDRVVLKEIKERTGDTSPLPDDYDASDLGVKCKAPKCKGYVEPTGKDYDACDTCGLVQ